MAQANLALRLLLELFAIGSVAIWGYHVGSGVARWVAAIVAPTALVVAWALVIAPGADVPIPQQARALLGSVVLLLAAAALYWAGHRPLAMAFAMLVLVNTLLMVAFVD